MREILAHITLAGMPFSELDLFSPGNPYGTVLGQPWVEAVIDLMKRNSTNHNLYFSLYLVRILN